MAKIAALWFLLGLLCVRLEKTNVYQEYPADKIQFHQTNFIGFSSVLGEK
jgi:hypothetical protein